MLLQSGQTYICPLVLVPIQIGHEVLHSPQFPQLALLLTRNASSCFRHTAE